jgi:hypothetical protein
MYQHFAKDFICRLLTEQGRVFIKDSHGYRALEDDLIDSDYWEKHKRVILNDLNMPLLSMGIEALLDRLQANTLGW